MLKLKELVIRNFMSVGNNSQSINLSKQDLVLVLGENLDLGGNDYRNGVGKTSIVNALCYVLYGKTISKIKVSNLINKTNEKHMSVSICFEKDGVDYYIERRKKPDKLIFKINNKDQEVENDAQGENAKTQLEIERVLGINYLMFCNIIVLNTYTDPFLKMAGGQQREFIEELLGITKLSDKANSLKEGWIKQTKDLIKDEQIKVKSLESSNDKIKDTCARLISNSNTWEINKKQNIKKLEDELTSMFVLDVDSEIQLHDSIQENNANIKNRDLLNKTASNIKRNIASQNSQLQNITNKLNSVQDNKTCFECKQTIEHSHVDLTSKYLEEQELLLDAVQKDEVDLQEIEKEISKINIKTLPSPFYSNILEARQHKEKMDKIATNLENILDSKNTYIDQIADLESKVEVIDYNVLRDLEVHLSHQEFLLKLLTNKDSFIRKKIINQNLEFLNSKLDEYLNKINLPHAVIFNSDLSVEITEHGRELDFDNLSRGERTRLSLSLSLAFREVYETLNGPTDLLFVDELIDTGLDPSGVESCLQILKNIVRNQNKTVFLISHRDELIGRIDNVFKVIKDGGFTRFEE